MSTFARRSSVLRPLPFRKSQRPANAVMIAFCRENGKSIARKYLSRAKRLTKYFQHNERAFSRNISRIKHTNTVQREHNMPATNTIHHSQNDHGDMHIPPDMPFAQALALYQQDQARIRKERLIGIPHAQYKVFADKDPNFLKKIFEWRQIAEKRLLDLQDTNAPLDQPKPPPDTKLDVTKPNYERRANHISQGHADTRGVSRTNLAEVDDFTDTDAANDSDGGPDTDTDDAQFTVEECEKAVAFLALMRADPKQVRRGHNCTDNPLI